MSDISTITAGAKSEADAVTAEAGATGTALTGEATISQATLSIAPYSCWSKAGTEMSREHLRVSMPTWYPSIPTEGEPNQKQNEAMNEFCDKLVEANTQFTLGDIKDQSEQIYQSLDNDTRALFKVEVIPFEQMKDRFPKFDNGNLTLLPNQGLSSTFEEMWDPDPSGIANGSYTTVGPNCRCGRHFISDR